MVTYRWCLAAIHPKIDTILCKISVVLINLCQYDKALEYFHDSLEMKRKCLPAIHTSKSGSKHAVYIPRNPLSTKLTKTCVVRLFLPEVANEMVPLVFDIPCTEGSSIICIYNNTAL